MLAVVSSIAAVALAALVLAAPATAAASVTVKLKDSFFSPSRVTLSREAAPCASSGPAS